MQNPEFLSKRSRLEKWAIELARAGLTDEQILDAFSKIPASVRRKTFFSWKAKGRPQQQIPPGRWLTWVAYPGRGWGKTDTGSHAVQTWEREGAGRIALIGATAADVRDVMVLGESGLLSAYPRHSRPWFRKSLRCVDFHKTGGGKAFLYSAEEPERLRGPQHHKAWGDELAAWKDPQRVLDQIRFGLRLPPLPQLLLTTTPKAIDVVRALVAEADEAPQRVTTTRGTTTDNAFNLADEFLDEMVRAYAGTRLGRQELEGEILEPVDGLFQRGWIKHLESAPPMGNIVVSVDPAITTRNDETGIVVVGRAGNRAYVLDDLSGTMTPNEWAAKAVKAAKDWRAKTIVAETNRGGDLVIQTIRNLDKRIPIKEVRANKGKDTRAEPVAALYEQGRVFHVGDFAKLEKQMVEWSPTSQDAARAQRQATSPDRLDALVWGITELGFHLGVATTKFVQLPNDSLPTTRM